MDGQNYNFRKIKNDNDKIQSYVLPQNFLMENWINSNKKDTPGYSFKSQYFLS